MSNAKIKDENKVSIGGQAVIEGVMMRGTSAMATAVRDSDGIIRVETKRIKRQKDTCLFFRLPFIRGIVSFINSLIVGTKVLMRSAEVFGEGEPSKFEKYFAKKFRINVMSVVTGLSLILGLGLAVLLFMFLPQFAREGIEKIFSSKFDIWAKSFIEGGIKLLIFILYILIVSCLKDIRRTFMYHGAEHKTITCFESGLDLTIENTRKCSKIHDRCGTTFMVFVMLISILLFAVVESLIGQNVEKIFRILLKLALLPIVAGISYELLKVLAKTKSPFVLPLKLPGMFLQTLTTRKPTDDMLEVAITSFKLVYDMDNDSSIEEREFIFPKKRKDVFLNVNETLRKNGIFEQAEAEWIVSIVLNIKRDEVQSDELVSVHNIDKINRIVSERITGRPLWYCIGNTDFYGYIIDVDERVLIPRPETEILVENAIKVIDEKSKVLDLCTGSGAIAIAIKKQTNAFVTAVDISKDALDIAEENAKNNGADIEFVQSDMFANLFNKKFDVIISNPPYIKTQDILFLQKEVQNFEPKMALDGGQDGLDFYRAIARNICNYVNENSVLFLECGIEQAKFIKELFSNFKSVEIIKDYNEIERIVKVVF